MLEELIRQNKLLRESKEPVLVREVLMNPGQTRESVGPAVATETTADGRVLHTAKISSYDTVNANLRVYPREVWEKNIARIAPLLAQGRVKGAVDHIGPFEGGNLQNMPVIWRDVWMQADKGIYGKYEIVKNHSKGADLQALKDAGGAIGWSTLGYGTGHEPSEEEQAKYGVDDSVTIMDGNFDLRGIDAVSDPSCYDAYDLPNKDNAPKGEKKRFDTLSDAQAYLSANHNGHGRIENESGVVLQQCRCGGGESVLVAGAATEKVVYRYCGESTGSIHLNHAAVAHAMSAVRAGKIDHGSFSGDATPKDKAHASYFLGIDTEFTPDEKGYYKFPIFSGDKVSAKGVGTAGHYAASTHPEIHAATVKISDAIKAKSGSDTQDSVDHSKFRLSNQADLANEQKEDQEMKTLAEVKEKAPELFAQHEAAVKDAVEKAVKEANAKIKPLVDSFNALAMTFRPLEGVALPEKEVKVTPEESQKQIDAVKAEKAEVEKQLASEKEGVAKVAGEKAELQKQLDGIAAEKAEAKRVTDITVKCEELLKDNVHADLIRDDVKEASADKSFSAEKVEALVKAKSEKYGKFVKPTERAPGGQNVSEEELQNEEEIVLKSESKAYADVKPSDALASI